MSNVKILLLIFVYVYSLSYVLMILGSGILGIAFDDFSISVLDIETRKIVRTFSGHHGRINDMVIVNSFSVMYTDTQLILQVVGFSAYVKSLSIVFSCE